MRLRSRTYLREGKKSIVDGLVYEIHRVGSSSYLYIKHEPSGVYVAKYSSWPVRAPTKVVKEIAGTLRSKFKDLDWNVPSGKLNMRGAEAASRAMDKIVDKYRA